MYVYFHNRRRLVLSFHSTASCKFVGFLFVEVLSICAVLAKIKFLAFNEGPRRPIHGFVLFFFTEAQKDQRELAGAELTMRTARSRKLE